jgi:hypothetical protein
MSNQPNQQMCQACQTRPSKKLFSGFCSRLCQLLGTMDALKFCDAEKLAKLANEAHIDAQKNHRWGY